MTARSPTLKKFFSALAPALFLLLTATPWPARAQQSCLPVHGLSFERVSGCELLAVRDGQNIAFITIDCNYSILGLPEKLGVFRFFSQNLCIRGAERRFHLDGKLFYVTQIQKFANVR